MQWQKTRLGDVAEIYDGPHATPPPCERSDALYLGIPHISATGHLDFTSPRFIAKEDYPRWIKRVKPRANDIVFSYEATLNLYALIPSNLKCCLGRRIGLVRPMHDTLDSRFLFYYFFSTEWRKVIAEKTISGATVDRISIEDFPNFPIPLPPLPTQRAIAEKLGRYDALIENNTRRIAILEAKAEQLYKEWFVRRQSPEHSATTGVTLSLGDAIKISRGLSYTSSEIDTDAGVQLINLKNIQPYGGFRYDGTKRFSGKYKPDQIVVRGDLVMGVTDMTQDRRAVGSVALMPPLKETSVISADLIKIESKIDKFFLYAMFRYGGLSRYISQFANGANVLHLRPQAIMGIKVQVPSKESIERFSERLRPMIALADNLNEQNALLAKERDLLLPRLMSGRLSCAAHESAPFQEEALP